MEPADPDSEKLPTLYKKTSTGAIQFWNIFVNEVPTQDGIVGQIVTEYGQIGTDSPQATSDFINEGKNVGKKNETTAFQQAQKEALAKWQKQKKKGYVETLEAAKKDETDELIEGGILPQLAHKYTEQGHKIKYPGYAQPKLDGIRCIAIVKDGTCTLWTRTRKRINSMPHIIQELEAIFESMDIIFDGELYNHKLKDNFEKIVSMVRQDEPDKMCALVEYHIYDIVDNNRSFQERIETLWECFQYMDEGADTFGSNIRLVETEEVKTENDVMTLFEKYRRLGYEGIMLRNKGAKYVNKRSYDLQKVKEFEDAEFDIVGIEEGRGKLAGHVGSFICRTADGKEFLAKMSGETERLREYFLNHSLWSGKQLTVKYQGLTGANGVPRFPVGIAIRDYE